MDNLLIGPSQAAGILLLAAALDFALGDPWSWPHPVQAMGWVISAYSRLILRLPLPKWPMRIGGIGLALLLIGGSGWLVGTSLWALGHVSVAAQTVIAIVLLASCFAGRSLRTAAEAVLKPLADQKIAAARLQLSMYVGRDTATLSAKQIRRAVLETVSENAIDGVLAPLFYAILGAVLGTWIEAVPGESTLPVVLSVACAIAYKAASTLDSMVGYQEAPYTHLGWFSARFEDALTWIPCRLSVATIALLSGRPAHVLRLCWRDARADPSPNAGWSEGAYAAALAVQMGGPNTYKGQIKIKPLLGDATRPISDKVIRQALNLTRKCCLIGLGLGVLGIGCRGLYQGLRLGAIVFSFWPVG